MSWFDDIFGTGNPADAAQPYLNQIPQYFNPYFQGGQNAYNTLQGQYGQLVNDPGALYNKFAQGYKASPGYQYNVDQATGAANRAGAAGGMLGSPAEQAGLAKTVSGLASQDFGNYLNSIMGMYNTGLGGFGGLNEMGFRGAENLGSNLLNQGNLAYAGQANQNQARGAMWGNLLGAGAGFLGGGI